ncbi:MAG: hypothetical protein IJQ61_01070 [Bacteroidales bacterium]|nr:hypothetical protein [Bacteroidales bacterium]MBR0245051.1 hypothetical protein [Bacteroidales bacterium]
MAQTLQKISDERLNQYMGARYGQSPETEQKYREAVQACMSILNLPLNVADIARMYNLDPQCLRGQLKRHYPDVIPKRNELRAKLGYVVFDQSRLHQSSMEKYVPAVKMLKETDLTVKEVAERCGVTYLGLQQHLIYYHKEVAELRLGKRMQALSGSVAVGGKDCNNRPVGPSATMQARYAPAIRMAQETDLPLTEIARRCGVEPRGLQGYFQKWHRDLMEERQRKREEALLQRKEAARPKVSRAEIVSVQYAPTVDMIRNGMSLSEAAVAVNTSPGNLRSWLKSHYPEVLDISCNGMIKTPEGVKMKRATYEQYKVIAQYMAEHPLERSKDVAKRFGVPDSSLHKVLSRSFPDIWEKHLEACSREREHRQAEYREALRQAMTEYDAGGVTMAELARRCGVTVKTFKWWRKIIKEESCSKQNPADGTV